MVNEKIVQSILKLLENKDGLNNMAIEYGDHQFQARMKANSIRDCLFSFYGQPSTIEDVYEALRTYNPKKPYSVEELVSSQTLTDALEDTDKSKLDKKLLKPSEAKPLILEILKKQPKKSSTSILGELSKSNYIMNQNSLKYLLGELKTKGLIGNDQSKGGWYLIENKGVVNEGTQS